MRLIDESKTLLKNSNITYRDIILFAQSKQKIKLTPYEIDTVLTDLGLKQRQTSPKNDTYRPPCVRDKNRQAIIQALKYFGIKF